MQTEIIKSDITQLDAEIRSLTIITDTENARASELLGNVKKLLKTVQERRDNIVKPIKSSIALIDNEFKKISEPLEELEALLKSRMLQYARAQETKRMEEERKIREARETEEKHIREEAEKNRSLINKITGKPVDENKIQEQLQSMPEIKPETKEAPKTVRSSAGTSTIKKFWTFKIINEQEIPREYLIVNESKIRQAIRDGSRSIAGIEIYEDSTIAVR
jgi:hypothetical protein